MGYGSGNARVIHRSAHGQYIIVCCIYATWALLQTRVFHESNNAGIRASLERYTGLHIPGYTAAKRPLPERLHVHYTGAKQVLHRRCTGATRALHGRYMGPYTSATPGNTLSLHRRKICANSPTVPVYRQYMSATRALNGRYTQAIRALHGHCTCVTWALYW